MREISSIPVWLVALVAAILAPGGVRLLHRMFERRLRARTLATISLALSTGCDARTNGDHAAEPRRESDHDVAS